MPTTSVWIDLGVASLTMADVTVSWLDLETVPQTNGFYTAANGLAIEYADATTLAILGGGPTAPAPSTTFRITGIPISVNAREFEIWETAVNTNSAGFNLDGTPPTLDDIKDNVDLLVALLEVAGGTTPVTITFQDEILQPVVGVEVSIWDVSLSVPVVPKVVSTTGGGITVGLPPGDYKAFYFKPFASFVSQQPVEFTVTGSPLSFIESVSTRFPELPTLPRITLFGWILQPDLGPVEGAEVQLSVLSTPTLTVGGSAIQRFEMTAKTDSSGRWEMYPVGGIRVRLSSGAAGYDRRGTLPLEGQLNWLNFAKEDI